mgnify:CR=1 FL=1
MILPDQNANARPLQGSARKAVPRCPQRRAAFFYIKGIKQRQKSHPKSRRGFPLKNGSGNCAFCTENVPKHRAEKIKKKIRIFLKKHLPIARRCDKISLGCKRLVRYKSCRPAICVDAGGCHPAIAAMGYFRGVCPILEPGERITDSDGIRSFGERSYSSCETMGTNVRI